MAELEFPNLPTLGKVAPSLGDYGPELSGFDATLTRRQKQEILAGRMVAESRQRETYADSVKDVGIAPILRKDAETRRERAERLSKMLEGLDEKMNRPAPEAPGAYPKLTIGDTIAAGLSALFGQPAAGNAIFEMRRKADMMKFEQQAQQWGLDREQARYLYDKLQKEITGLISDADRMDIQALGEEQRVRERGEDYQRKLGEEERDRNYDRWKTLENNANDLRKIEATQGGLNARFKGKQAFDFMKALMDPSKDAGDKQVAISGLEDMGVEIPEEWRQWADKPGYKVDESKARVAKIKADTQVSQERAEKLAMELEYLPQDKALEHAKARVQIENAKSMIASRRAKDSKQSPASDAKLWAVVRDKSYRQKVDADEMLAKEQAKAAAYREMARNSKDQTDSQLAANKALMAERAAEQYEKLRDKYQKEYDNATEKVSGKGILKPADPFMFGVPGLRGTIPTR